MNNRLIVLQKFLTRNNLEAIIIKKPENIYYFSGFTGSTGMLLLTKKGEYLLTDFRYIEQANSEASNFEVINCVKSVYNSIVEIIEKDSVLSVGFEGDCFSFNDYSKLSKLKKTLKYKNINVDELRSVKDEEEIFNIKKAVEIADEAFKYIVNFVKPGITELDLAIELEIFMRRLGSQRTAFTTIVASGVRGALPHGVATDKVINEGELVTLDFGAVYKGYHSDITRTFCVGKADDKQKQLYEFVLQAQLLGVKSVKPEANGQFVDEIVRRYIIKGGYGQFFGHGLGHGVGLEIHEFPRLSPASLCTALKPNMVVTVEPGVYLPGWGGIRIEDTVMVTAEGCEILTKSSKHLIEIDLNI